MHSVTHIIQACMLCSLYLFVNSFKELLALSRITICNIAVIRHVQAVWEASGESSTPSLAPKPNFISHIDPIRGFSSGVGAYVGDKRNILDYHRRQLADKAMWRDADLPSSIREKAREKLSELPRNSSFTRIRNRCIFTGRSRAVYEKFRMSRIVFRELASKGELLGVKKHPGDNFLALEEMV